MKGSGRDLVPAYWMMSFVNRMLAQFFKREQMLQIGEHQLKLDRWARHENEYYLWSQRGFPQGAMCFDFAIDLLTRPGDCVLDAGANIGFTSLLFLRAGAKLVHAIEPDPRNAVRLRAIGAPQLRVHECALGKDDEELDLHLSTRHMQGSTLDPRQVALFPRVFRGSQSVRVPVRRVDSMFLDAKLDIMKIDIEGAESAMLAGAQETLQRSPPRAIILESYDQYFAETDAQLKPHYRNVVRLVGDRNAGVLRAVSANTPAKSLSGRYFVNPPTYVYSLDAWHGDRI